ncbi:MAG TPA: cytochrome c peroxidase [Steroidobacteraceae bacterium]|nr:cytochrome c peroxidase [Steroidobacteraceae bacterium]
MLLKKKGFRLWGGWVLIACAMGLPACGGGGDSGSSSGSAPSRDTLSVAAAAGKALFNDKSLSASGKQSCATCHVAARAFTADPATDQGLPVPLGGPNMDIPGFRNTPSLLYVSLTPGFFLDGGTPTGGFFRDGRASSLDQQAQLPFITPFEMANQDAAEVVSRLQNSPDTLAAFIAAYGAQALANPQVALADIGLALSAYETEDADFHPFTSKFDYWQQGQAQLTAEELQGLALFNNPGKGNCTACHPSQRQGYSEHPLFTDFTYDNIGVPRNWNIPASAVTPVSPISGVSLASYMPTGPSNVPTGSEYAYYDMGLCGPFQTPSTDPNPRPSFFDITTLCGLFKVPSLRNVAVTSPYFHNGVFKTIHEVVEWYVTRDINNNTGNNPAPVDAGPNGNPYFSLGTFYTNAAGTPDLLQYNDLPVDFDANVNIAEVPYTPPTFEGGQAPTLTASEIDAVVAFLCTLTDGYDPANPSAYNVPAQCQPTAATPAAAQTSGN